MPWWTYVLIVALAVFVAVAWANTVRYRRMVRRPGNLMDELNRYGRRPL